MQRAAAQGSALVLMFIDLDDFKRANDVGGHRTGDEILIAVGAALTHEMRDDATVARIGGARRAGRLRRHGHVPGQAARQERLVGVSA